MQQRKRSVLKGSEQQREAIGRSLFRLEGIVGVLQVAYEEELKSCTHKAQAELMVACDLCLEISCCSNWWTELVADAQVGDALSFQCIHNRLVVAQIERQRFHEVTND